MAMEILAHNKKSQALEDQWQATHDGNLMDDPDWQFVECDECQQPHSVVMVFPGDWRVCAGCLNRAIGMIQAASVQKGTNAVVELPNSSHWEEGPLIYLGNDGKVHQADLPDGE